MTIRRWVGLAWTGVALQAVLVAGAAGQVHRLAELTAEDVGALDRARTVVLIPGGMLEEHGPYLPVFTDGYWNERMATMLAEAIVARPGWKALIFPSIPLGNSGANDVAGRFSYPGTYSLRQETLRSVFMDLACELGEQGFQKVLIVHAHGAPSHNQALDEAGDFFTETFGGFMVNVGGLMPVMEAWGAAKTPAQKAEDGLALHAGMDETSWMLFLRPDLVRSEYADARAFASDSLSGLIQLGRAAGWLGYFGSPRLATAAHGARVWQTGSRAAVDVVLEILDGKDPRSIPRFADIALRDPVEASIDAAMLRNEDLRRQLQQEWLRTRQRRQ